MLGQRVALVAFLLTAIGCSSTRLLHQGYFDYSIGRFVPAKAELQKAYARKPSSDAAFLIAECARNLNEQDSIWYNVAIQHAKLEYSRTELVSDKVRSMRTIALAYYHLRDYQQARSWFDKLTMGVSTNPDVYFYLGHCSVELKDFDAAMVYLTKYDRLHNDELRTLLGRCKDNN